MTGPTTTGSIDAKLTIDKSSWDEKAAEAKAEARELGSLSPEIKVDANVAPALAKLNSVVLAEGRLETATRQAANSASTAYIASERLKAMQEKRGATELQLAAATEASARADRNAEAAEMKVLAATTALNAARHEAISRADEQAGANEKEAASTEKATQANRRHVSGLQVLVAMSPLLLSAAAPIAGAAVGLGAAFGAMGVSGVLAIKGIKDAMEVGDAVGNTYATGLQIIKDDLSSLAGTSATAMLGGFSSVIGDINSRMPFLTQMTGQFAGLLGNIGGTALSGVLAGLEQMNPLLQAGGIELGKFVTWLFSFNGSNGFSQFIGYAMDSLPGVMHLIENLVTTAGHLLEAFAPLGPVVIGVLNGITDVLNGLPLPVLAGLVTTAVAIGPAFTIAAPAIRLAGSALALFGIEAQLSVPVVGILTAAIAGIGVAVATSALGTDQGTHAFQDYTAAIQADNDAIGDHVKAQVAKELVDNGAAQAAQRLGLSLMTVQQAAEGNATAIAAVKNVTDEAAKGIIDWTSGGAYASEKNKQLSSDVDKMRGSVLGATGAIADQVEKQKLLKDMMAPTTGEVSAQSIAAQNLAGAYGATVAGYQSALTAQQSTATQLADTTIKMQLQNDAAGLLKGALDSLNGKALSAAQAQNAFDSSLANMGDHVSATGKKIHFTTTNIDDMSAASVSLRGQLNGQIANLQGVVEANGGLANSTGKAKEEMEAMRQKIIDNAVAHGVDKDAVTAYVDNLLTIPKSIPPTKLDVDNAAAAAKLEYTKWLLDSLHNKTVFVDVQTSDSVNTGRGDAKGVDKPTAYAHGGMVNYLAGGGFPDFKPQGSDTVPAMLTPGEIVVKRSSVASLGADNLLHANKTGQWPGGGGGQVTVNLILDGTIIDTRIVDVANKVIDGVSRQIGGMRR